MKYLKIALLFLCMNQIINSMMAMPLADPTNEVLFEGLQQPLTGLFFWGMDNNNKGVLDFDLSKYTLPGSKKTLLDVIAPYAQNQSITITINFIFPSTIQVKAYAENEVKPILDRTITETLPTNLSTGYIGAYVGDIAQYGSTPPAYNGPGTQGKYQSENCNISNTSSVINNITINITNQNFSVSNTQYPSTLAYILAKDNVTALKAFIKQNPKFNFNALNNDLNLKNVTIEELQNLKEQIYKAYKMHNQAEITFLINIRNNLVANLGVNPLIYAIYNGASQCIQYLVKQNLIAQSLTTQLSNGSYPLDYAVSPTVNNDILKILLPYYMANNLHFTDYITKSLLQNINIGIQNTFSDLFFWGMGSNGYKALSFHLANFSVNSSNLFNLINQYVYDYPVHIHMTITQNQGNTCTATITNALYLNIDNTAVPLLSKPISINIPSLQPLTSGYIAAYVGDIQFASQAYAGLGTNGKFAGQIITFNETTTTIAIYIYNGIIAVSAS